MPGKTCVDFKNGIYHVYNRGVNKQNIFCDDPDRWFFINLCQKANLKYEVEFLAFCLMGNHYHLFVHTPQANLSKIMKFIDERFSKYFINKYKASKKNGHTFMGPYGRRIVQTDYYASILLSYIHNNPFKDGFVEHPADYKWSSYSCYESGIDKFNFINKELLADKFVPLARDENRRAIVDQEILDWEPNNYTHASLFLGDQKFIEDIIDSNFKGKDGFTKLSFNKLKPRMNSDAVRNLVNSLNVNPRLRRNLLIYSLLKWTELQSSELETEFGIKAASLRSIKSLVDKKINSGDRDYAVVIQHFSPGGRC